MIFVRGIRLRMFAAGKGQLFILLKDIAAGGSGPRGHGLTIAGGVGKCQSWGRECTVHDGWLL